MNENELRAGLQELVPPTPPAIRVAAAKDRALRVRKQQFLGLATAFALVIGAVMVPVMLFRGESKTAVSPPDVAGCPTPERRGEASGLSGLPGDTIELGASSVRLCNPGWGSSFLAPRDALVQDPDRLASAINRLPLAIDLPGSFSCPAVGGTTWIYLFTYPDGRSSLATATTAGCKGIWSGGLRGTAADAVALYDQFRSALQEQRSSRMPPKDLEIDLTCPVAGGTQSWVELRRPELVPNLVRASVCLTRTGSFGTRVRTIPLTGAALEAVLSDYAVNQGGRGLPGPNGTTKFVCPRYTFGLSVLAQDEWGDRYQFDLGCETFRITRSTYWRPSDEVMNLLFRTAGVSRAA